ncbi:MAG: hypothetical protein L6Q84_12205 [Polyangiaceae bacterium]|nr:hypothetical protein [Polyangiaceae bacterium]
MRSILLGTRALVLASAFLLAGCGSSDDGSSEGGDDTPLFDAEDDIGADGKADGWSSTINADNLNGLWTTTIDGEQSAEVTMIESWPAIDVRIHMGGTTYQADFNAGNFEINGQDVRLVGKANKKGVSDDTIEGVVAGKNVKMKRDTSSKAPVTLTFPGDRPYRHFLRDEIMPKASYDREAYKTVNSYQLKKWLEACQLYKSGSWAKWMKGETSSERYKNLNNLIFAVDKQRITPHAVTRNYKFYGAMQTYAKPETIGLATSSLGMYFSTGAGGAVRMKLTDDTMAYFITDKVTREAKIGLVVMATPTHAPLASTFGRQLLDLGAGPKPDTLAFTRAMMDLMVKSDTKNVGKLSPAGRSSLVDWYSVMAIEDYRGIAFNNGLDWGYNMTNMQFFGLVARALARPTEKDSKGKPVIGQVIVGNQLRPGEASYGDVLNNGNDMQEYPDLAKLKQLATKYLTAKHPTVVAAVKAAYKNVVPESQLNYNAKNDVFHWITSQLYGTNEQLDALKGAAADPAIESVVKLIQTLEDNSADFEAYILTQGITKSNEPAPISTGF